MQKHTCITQHFFALFGSPYSPMIGFNVMSCALVCRRVNSLGWWYLHLLMVQCGQSGILMTTVLVSFQLPTQPSANRHQYRHCFLLHQDSPQHVCTLPTAPSTSAGIGQLIPSRVFCPQLTRPCKNCYIVISPFLHWILHCKITTTYSHYKLTPHSQLNSPRLHQHNYTQPSQLNSPLLHQHN